MFSIGVVARQTGVEIGTLRKWEARYGFPQPMRQNSGQRYYSASDIDKLLLVVRRINGGERVGKVIRELSSNPYSSEVNFSETPALPAVDEVITDALNALLVHDVHKFKFTLEEALSSHSVFNFVEKIATPLAEMVGEYWARGRLPIHGEHLFSCILESFLTRESTLSRGANQQPTVLLTSPPGELHTLGLSMVDAVLGEAGIACLRLPGGLPIPEIVAASAAYRIKVVGISASCLSPPRMLGALVHELRAALPSDISLWFGGSGMKKIVNIPSGVSVISSLHELFEVCEEIHLIGEKTSHAKRA